MRQNHQGQSIHAVKRKQRYCQCLRCSLLYSNHLLLNSICPAITVSHIPNKTALCWWFLCTVLAVSVMTKIKTRPFNLIITFYLSIYWKQSFLWFTSLSLIINGFCMAMILITSENTKFVGSQLDKRNNVLSTCWALQYKLWRVLKTNSKPDFSTLDSDSFLT